MKLIRCDSSLYKNIVPMLDNPEFYRDWVVYLNLSRTWRAAKDGYFVSILADTKLEVLAAIDIHESEGNDDIASRLREISERI